MLLYKFPFGPLSTNAILIGCTETRKGAVIDPSLGATDVVLQQAAASQLKIEAILLTHSHWDHIADVAEVKKRTGAPLYVHPLDQENVEHPGTDGLPLFVHIVGTTVDHLLRDGQIVAVGNLELRVLHTPGHSPGGVCYYVQGENTLIAGDTLFRGSIGRMDLPTGNPDQMQHSLHRLAQLPPETRVIPGHGADTTIAAEFRR